MSQAIAESSVDVTALWPLSSDWLHRDRLQEI
jgi:hypothetical protein